MNSSMLNAVLAQEPANNMTTSERLAFVSHESCGPPSEVST